MGGDPRLAAVEGDGRPQPPDPEPRGPEQAFEPALDVVRVRVLDVHPDLPARGPLRADQVQQGPLLRPRHALGQRGRDGDGDELVPVPVAERPPPVGEVRVGQERLQHGPEEPAVVPPQHRLEGFLQRFLDGVPVGGRQLRVHPDGHALLRERRQVVDDLVQAEEDALVDQVLAEERGHDAGPDRLDGRPGPAGHPVVAPAARPLGNPGLDPAVPLVERRGVGPAEALADERRRGQRSRRSASGAGTTWCA